MNGIPLVLQIPPPRLPELDESEIVVSVSHVETPNHFWCHRVNDIARRDYNHITTLTGVRGTKLERFVPNNSYRRPPIHVQIGNLVMGPFEGEYYRAKVLSISQFDYNNPTLQKVRLCFIDFGNAGEAFVSELRKLPPALMQFPPLAFECRLIGVAPSPISSSEGKWSDESTKFFKDLAHEQVSTSKVSIVFFKKKKIPLKNINYCFD